MSIKNIKKRQRKSKAEKKRLGLVLIAIESQREQEDLETSSHKRHYNKVWL